MPAPSPTVPLPDGFAPLLAEARAQLGEQVGALLLFGSCLSAHTQQASSVPDLLAVVDDLDATLRQLGCGVATQKLGHLLPPLTLALRARTQAAAAGRTLAKLNLIELPAARRAVRELPDLYLAGRLSKPTAWLWHRDAAWQKACEELLDEAAAAVADLTLRGVAAREPLALDEVVLLYIGQSYLAEVRPEGPEKWRALHAAFPDFYRERIAPLLLARAPAVGLQPRDAPTPGGGGMALHDQRTAAQRRDDQRARSRLLRRSRLRTITRWPKMAVVYRGWLPYLLGKLRRVLRQRWSASPPAMLG